MTNCSPLFLPHSKLYELLSKFVRYAVTGGVAAVVDVGVFAMLVGAANLSVPPRKHSQFCTAALLNFRLTSKYVFSQ